MKSEQKLLLLTVFSFVDSQNLLKKQREDLNKEERRHMTDYEKLYQAFSEKLSVVKNFPYKYVAKKFESVVKVKSNLDGGGYTDSKQLIFTVNIGNKQFIFDLYKFHEDYLIKLDSVIEEFKQTDLETVLQEHNDEVSLEHIEKRLKELEKQKQELLNKKRVEYGVYS